MPMKMAMKNHLNSLSFAMGVISNAGQRHAVHPRRRRRRRV